MNLKFPALVILSVAAIALSYPALRAQDRPKSTWDGIYTEAQAKRGADKYREHCEWCHRADLTGEDEASPLTGWGFSANWDGLPLGSLYERMRRDMPQMKAGTLSNAVNADILAYMLQVNKFPAGETELPPSKPILDQIRYDAEKPKDKK
jgi:hypothetical protein